MENLKLKEDMMELWKATFKDSDEYIQLIFDTYFNPEYVVTDYRNEKLVAGLLGIPYQFGNRNHRITGLYLCGLATDPAYRRQGIMSGLISRIEDIARGKDIPFLFLIPADRGLYKYYHDRGFVASFYKSVDRYTSVHDFDREYGNLVSMKEEPEREVLLNCYGSTIVSVIDSIDRLEAEIVDSLSSFVVNSEYGNRGLKIFHSVKDINAAISECLISGGEIYYSTVGDKITGVAFTSIDEGTGVEKNVKVYCHVVLNQEGRYRLLGYIKSRHGDCSMTIENHSPKYNDRKVLWEPFYEGTLPEAKTVPAVGSMERVYDPAAHVKMYGMSKILNVYEILKFMNKEWHGLKYSILVKDDEDSKIRRYESRNGELRCCEEGKRERTGGIMSLQNIGEILLRKSVSDPMIEEAFGIPSLGGSISLMLD